jgi:hypothetical protein
MNTRSQCDHLLAREEVLLVGTPIAFPQDFFWPALKSFAMLNQLHNFFKLRKQK